MKYFIVSVIVLYSVSIFSMEELPDHFLTGEEDTCFDWIHMHQADCCNAYYYLPEADQEILKMDYSDSIEMGMAMVNYATNIVMLLKHKDVSIPNPHFTIPFIAHVMLKVKKAIISSNVQPPVGPTTARMWVYQKELTEQDRSALQKDNFMREPETANEVLCKYGTKVIDVIKEIDCQKVSKHYYEKSKQDKKITGRKRASIKRLYNIGKISAGE